MVDHRFGRVDVFWLGIIHHAPAERNDIAPHINDGHHHAVAEDIIQIALGATLDKAGGFQFRLGKAAVVQVVQKADKIFRCIAQAKPADGRIRKAAFFAPVAAGHGGFRRWGVELVIKIARGVAVDLQQAGAGTAFLVVLLRHGHPGAARQLFNSFHIAQVGNFAHKVNHIPRRTAAKAVKTLGIRVDGKRRGFLVMERAQPGIGPPAMTQLHILADYFGNIIACNHFLYVFLWDQWGSGPPFAYIS